MIMILLLISFLMSMIFMTMNHPLSMGMVLLFQTILISLITGFFNTSFWFSYILFLIMVGGMLVLFIYMTSIASNEMFKYSNKILMLIITFFMISIFMYLNTDLLIFMMNNINKELLINNAINLSLSKFLNYPSNIILLLMMIYLFITLIAVVKITNINIGPLRQKF